jgi:acetylornithine deacetylase/succinyl-diaminopimelate desuccinylase family protein
VTIGQSDVASASEDEGGREVTELLERLVRAESPNPPGDERKVIGVVRDYLESCPGVVVEECGVDPTRPMLIATIEAPQPGRCLIFAGHVDTVPTGDGWTRDPYGAETDDSHRLYGLGASDMKGGVAAFLVAMRRLAVRRDEWAGTIVGHIVPDEEPGGELGTKVLLDRGLLVGDGAVVAEPSEMLVYCAQKGNIFASLQTTGRTAHGSRPDEGVNAISAAARLIVDLEERLGAILAERQSDLVGHATVNVGTIQGGLRTNMVPDECALTVDRRVLPEESLEQAVAELREFIGGRAEMTVENVGAAFRTAEDHPLVVAAQDAVAAVSGKRSPVGGLVGSSDARFYADGAAIPTIILGPGVTAQSHVPDEWIDLDLVAQSVEVYERLALSFLSEPAAGVGDKGGPEQTADSSDVA